jgi:hypothetical protein
MVLGKAVIADTDPRNDWLLPRRARARQSSRANHEYDDEPDGLAGTDSRGALGRAAHASARLDVDALLAFVYGDAWAHPHAADVTLDPAGSGHLARTQAILAVLEVFLIVDHRVVGCAATSAHCDEQRAHKDRSHRPPPLPWSAYHGCDRWMKSRDRCGRRSKRRTPRCTAHR